MPAARFTLQNDPQTAHEIEKEAFLIGRSSDCDIVVNDLHASRQQAQVRFQDGQYRIENLGKNPIFVNGREVGSRILQPGDSVTIGMTTLIFETVAEEPQQPVAEPAYEGATIAVTSDSETPSAPRLVIATESGDSRIQPLDKERVLIGRGDEADVLLNDTSISRKHCVIEVQPNAAVLRNLSQVNPVLVNDKQVTETRLYNGDQIQIGSISMAFISGRTGDQRPLHIDSIKQAGIDKLQGMEKKKLRTIAIAAGVSALLVFSGLVYLLVRPSKPVRQLNAVEKMIDAGQFEQALASLETLVGSGLEEENLRRARQLQSSAIEARVEQLEADGYLEDARNLLVDHLKTYGGGQDADKLWEKVDLLRMKIAAQYTAAGEFDQAIRQFAAIEEDSPYFESSQKGIRQVWLEQQRQSRQQQNLDEMLKEAEVHFQAKRYLTPVNNNAYSIYQAVLAIDPSNPVALDRIEAMKAFYLRLGNKFFERGDLRKALVYFERCRIVDPDTPGLEEKIRICKQGLKAKGRKQKGSSNMVKYLYKTQSGE